MSYKFNLDHTLTIGDIHDMITIDIKPETRCTITGGDIEIHGYLTFQGSYLTPDLEQAPFEGSVPLDITLPYLGGAPDVYPEVVTFDYQVANKESLTLNLEMALRGYPAFKEEEKVMDAWLDDTASEIVYEEAVIEPFDFATTGLQEAHVPMTDDFPHIDEHVMSCPDHNFGDVVVDERTTPVREEEKASEEQIPYSPLVDIKDEKTVEIENIPFGEIKDVEKSDEPAINTQPVEQKSRILPEKPVRKDAPLTESAAALMDELFAMKRGTAFKEKEAPAMMVESDSVDELTSGHDEGAEVVDVNEPFDQVSDSVARQFSDGNVVIKMVYVADEAHTLGSVLTQHDATLDDVWNLENLADGLTVGDCVMLRYEKNM